MANKHRFNIFYVSATERKVSKVINKFRKTSSYEIYYKYKYDPDKTRYFDEFYTPEDVYEEPKSEIH